MGSGAKPQKLGEFSRIFVLKVNLQWVRLLLTISYRKNCRSRMYYLLPNNVVGEQLLPAPPVPACAYGPGNVRQQIS